MNGKVMIVGTGNVGASIAYAIVNQRTAVRDLVLIDANAAGAQGQMLDLEDTMPVGPAWLGIHATESYSDAASCDICVITAGAGQKPGQSRSDLVDRNSEIVGSIVDSVVSSGFSGIFLIVSNPVDTLALVAYHRSGFPAHRVIGSGTVLDTARLRSQVAEELSVYPKSVHVYQVGEHGDSEFALWSSGSVGGERLTSLLSEEARARIEDRTRNAAYEIIEKKGATSFGIGSCAVHIINSILNDERRVLTVSSLDEAAGVYYGYPVIVGSDGIMGRLHPELSTAEQEKLARSIAAIGSVSKGR